VLAVDRDRDRLDSVRQGSPGVETLVGDLAAEHAVEDFARQALTLQARIDVLINIAGIGFVGDLTSTSTEQGETIAVNVRAPFLLC